MIQAILDTNVVVQAVIGSPKSASAQVVQAVVDREFHLIASAEVLLELAKVLQLPKIAARHGRSEGEIWAFVSNLELYARPLVEPRPHTSEVRDLSDRKLTDLAFSAQPDFLVTKDRRHLLRLKRIGRTRVVTPAAFLRHLK